jgi:uncharacterized membrane-anchored protein
MTILPLITLFFGMEILLETQPYDPRDIFRGDYISLRYKINEVEVSKLPREVKEQDDYYRYKDRYMYAVMKKVDDFYEVDRITLKKPDNGIYIICKPSYFFEYAGPQPQYQKVYVEYRLDRYFVRENTGRELEDASRKGQLIARVKVFKGYPLLVEVFAR